LGTEETGFDIIAEEQQGNLNHTTAVESFLRTLDPPVAGLLAPLSNGQTSPATGL
jgi:hypothetical protein